MVTDAFKQLLKHIFQSEALDLSHNPRFAPILHHELTSKAPKPGMAGSNQFPPWLENLIEEQESTAAGLRVPEKIRCQHWGKLHAPTND